MNKTENSPKKINMFKLTFEGNKSIYRYETIPVGENEDDFIKKGAYFFSLKKLDNCVETNFSPYNIRKLISNIFENRLKSNGFQVDRKYTFYTSKDKIKHKPSNEHLFSMFKGFEYRFVPLDEDMFLCIDYKLIVKFNASISDLLKLNAPADLLKGNSVEIKEANKIKRNGLLVDIDGNGYCKVKIYGQGVELLPPKNAYVLCRPEIIQQILKEIGHFENIISLQRKYSLLKPQERLNEIKTVVRKIHENDIFPISIENLNVSLCNEPLSIEEVGYSLSYDDFTLKFDYLREEPKLQFDSGSYLVNKPMPVNYPPYAKIESLTLNFYYPKNKERQIENLSTEIKQYLETYYSVNQVTINKKIIDENPTSKMYSEKIQSSLKFENKLDVGIVYIPEVVRYYKSSPYYKIKAYFASQGFPTQMITDKTFVPSRYPINYTVLNICSAIFAKCGGIPWVLGAKLNETDLLIGISLSTMLSRLGEYTQNNRYIGIANIFNEYGKWMYFCGTADEYHKNQIAEQFDTLIRKFSNYYLSTNYPVPKNIILHNSRRLSHINRKEIIKSLTNCFGEDIKVAFVTVDESHNYRTFDFASKDGSLPRRYFIYLSENQFLLSTTGESNLKGAFRMGTPKMLNVNVNQYPMKFLTLEDVAFQILSLTKLNWAAVSSPVQREPITVKYANKLAKLTANMDKSQWNEFNDRLFNKPWFI